MHYKNGREAKNGDRVIFVPPVGQSGLAVSGILYDARADGGNDCNGRIAVPQYTDQCADLKNVLHADDIAAATIPDSTIKPEAEPAPAGGIVAAAAAIILALLLLCGLSAHASLIGSPTYIVCPTNSAAVSSGTVVFQMPSYTETITGLTNGATQFTNNLIESFSSGGVNYTIIASSTVSASGSTASFSVTNNAQSVTVTNFNILQIYPQSAGASNTFSLQAN